jgi:hypothetical protein
MRRMLVVGVLLLAAAVARADTSAQIEKKILEQGNAHRVKKDVAKLVIDDKLKAIAQAHARALARADKYGDDDKDGHILDKKGPQDRVKAGGYKYARFAENVGYNFGHKEPAEKMMKDWLASSAHEKNLTDKDFTQTGIGAAKGESGRWYFVQLFGRPLSQQTTVEAVIENRTKHTIAFTLGSKKYELKADQKAKFSHYQSSGEIKIAITWPGSKESESMALADKAHYAFVEKKKGVFAFEKVEP